MSKKSTIHDIAKSLNTTASTVSRALAGHPRISDETKRLVREAAEKAGYQMNGVASALRSGRTFTIGVIVPTADRSFFSKVVRGIEEETSRANYNVMICQSNDSYAGEMKDIAALMRAQVDGILLSNAKETVDFQHLEALKKQNVPVVLFDRVVHLPGISTVTVDDFGGAYQATKHLIEQGCRRIAHMTPPQQHLHIYNERKRGYLEALEAHGLPFYENYIHRNDLTLEGGRAGATFFWSLPEPPDAIFCASDLSALGAMQFLKSRGLKIPRDVALCGFANEPFTSYIEPALTTVSQHPEEIGKVATQLFFEQIEAPKGAFLHKNITLNTNLIIRESSLWGR